MSTTTLDIYNSIVSEGVLEKNDDVIIDNQRAYTYHDNDTKTVLTMYSRQNIDNSNEEIIVNIHSLDSIELNVNSYKSDKYNWKKVSDNLIINKDEFNPNYCVSRKIDDENYMVFLINNSEIHNEDNIETIRIYLYKIGGNWSQLININIEGKVVYLCNNGVTLVSNLNNKLIFYKLSDISVNSLNIKKVNELNIKSSIPEYENIAKLIPSYFYVNEKHIIFAMGVLNDNRYLITDAKIYDYNDGEIINNNNIILIQRKLSLINNTAMGISINDSSTRFCFINLSLFFIEQINQYVPRYGVSVYDKNNSEWFEFGSLLGSTIDPTYVEANPLTPVKDRINRKVTAINTAEYRNISSSLDDDGIYVGMWTPFVKYDNDVIVLKPFYEKVSSFVRVDSINEKQFFDETTINQ